MSFLLPLHKPTCLLLLLAGVGPAFATPPRGRASDHAASAAQPALFRWCINLEGPAASLGLPQDGQFLVVQCFTDDQAVPDFRIPYRKYQIKYYIYMAYPVAEHARWQVLLDGMPLEGALVTLEAHAPGEDPYQAPEGGTPGAQAAAAGYYLNSPFSLPHSASSSSFLGLGTDPSPFGRPRFKGQGQMPLSPVPMRPLFSPAASTSPSGHWLQGYSPDAGTGAPGPVLLGQSLGATPPAFSNQALSAFGSPSGLRNQPGYGGMDLSAAPLEGLAFPAAGATSERSTRKRSGVDASTLEAAPENLVKASKRARTRDEAQSAPTIGKGCKICGEAYQTARGLAIHRAQQHGAALPLVCPVAQCAWEGVQRNVYALHYLENHLKLKPFTCAICGLKTSNPYTLKAHFKDRHPGQTAPDVGMAEVREALGNNLPPPRIATPFQEAAAAQSSRPAGANWKPQRARRLVPSDPMGAGTGLASSAASLPLPAIVLAGASAAAGQSLAALPPQPQVQADNPPPRTLPQGPAPMAFLPARPALSGAGAPVDAAPGAAVPLLDQASLREEGEALLFRLANINLKTFSKGLRRWPAIEAALEANQLQDAEAGLAKLRMLEKTSLEFPSPAR